MKHSKKSKPSSRPAAERNSETFYTLEVVSEIAGIPRRTVLHYKEHGLIPTAAATGPGGRQFDDEALRALRRIEHLRAHYEMNLRTLKFTLGLLGELERLRDNLGSRR
jgi:DNA-binding transcriptional MerR regulator